MQPKYPYKKLPDTWGDKNPVYDIEATFVRRTIIHHPNGWGFQKILLFKNISALDGTTICQQATCNGNSFTDNINLVIDQWYVILCKMPFNRVNNCIQHPMEFIGITTQVHFTMKENSIKKGNIDQYLKSK